MSRPKIELQVVTISASQVQAGAYAMLLAEKPQLLVCGHSHILKVINDKWLGVLTINPGAAGRQGWQTVRTLILLTIDQGSPTDCEVVELGDK